MTINNPELYLEGVWDWSILDGCFGKTKIRPTDADGMTEHHGQFLFFETKQPGAGVPQGQQIMFNALRSLGCFTVVIIWGYKPVVEHLEVLYPPPFQPVPKKAATLADLRNIARWWYRRANATRSR